MNPPDRTRLQHTLSLLFALACLATGCARPAGLGAAGATSTTTTVTIYFTGDLHEHTANLPRIAHFVGQRRREEGNVLFLDAGDRFNKGETPVMYTHGEAVMAIVGACGYDAVAIGNHDLSFGADRLGRLADRYRVPVTACNVAWPGSIAPAIVRPYRVFPLLGVRVAVVGSAAEAMNHRSDELLAVRPLIAAIQPVVDQARREADIVVLLTHVDDERDLEIARGLRGVDAIVGGHSHSLFRKMVVEPVSGTVIHKTGMGGLFIGQIDLTWDGRRVTGRQTRVIEITPDMGEDPAVRAVRDRCLAAADAAEPLANVPRALSADQWTAWLAEAVAADAGADVVLLPGPLASAGLPAGKFTLAELPDITRLEVVRFTVPDRHALAALLAEVRKAVPKARLYTLAGKTPGSGDAQRTQGTATTKGTTTGIRVAYPCVKYDQMIDPKDSGLRGATVSAVERLEGRSLWDIAVAAARRQKTILAPAAAPSTPPE
jgi:2',3'-cyclic-nucleotide 2'-phosphodiesterase (5'-nucleotidase family)